METVDTLIIADHVLTVDAEDRELEAAAVAVRDGHIVAVCEAATARARYTASTVVERPGHVLLPGFVNSHGHSAMSLFRGMADDLPLMEWLSDHIWPTEARVMNEAFVYDGARLAMAEMLRGGTTCFNDMYFYPDQVGRAAAAVGMRAVLGLILIDFPTAWAASADEYVAKGIELHDAVRALPLITTAWAPHAPYTVSDGPLERIRVLAEEMDVPVHIHLHETLDEVEQALAATGQRPLARLDALGLLDPRLLAVHMTQLEPAEIELIAVSGVNVVHCPESNLKLASGFCPVEALREAGVNVALGTDGAASNNDLDMLGEMRTAALVAKAVAGSASALPAREALRMATINGAQALGLADRIGSIEVGKCADLVTIDMRHPATQPLYHPTSAVVYAAGRDQVRDVWVAGRRLVEDATLTELDVGQLFRAAQGWRERVGAGGRA